MATGVQPFWLTLTAAQSSTGPARPSCGFGMAAWVPSLRRQVRSSWPLQCPWLGSRPSLESCCQQQEALGSFRQKRLGVHRWCLKHLKLVLRMASARDRGRDRLLQKGDGYLKLWQLKSLQEAQQVELQNKFSALGCVDGAEQEAGSSQGKVDTKPDERGLLQALVQADRAKSEGAGLSLSAGVVSYQIGAPEGQHHSEGSSQLPSSADVFRDPCGAEGHWRGDVREPHGEATAAGSSLGSREGRGEQTLAGGGGYLEAALWATCSGGKWADAAAGHSSEDEGLGWLGASERSSTVISASSTPAMASRSGAGRRFERRRLQKVRHKLAREIESKEVVVDDFGAMQSTDALLQHCQRQLGRGLTSEEVRVLQSLGARAREAVASRM